MIPCTETCPPHATLAEEATRWNALLTRDRTADGQFFYSVRTTGVYCRPACAARLANRNNVQFHETREAAERAGFRPCKRCKPEQEARQIRFAVSDSALGLLVAAQSDEGLCALFFGDEPEVLRQELAVRFPDALLIEDAMGLAPLIAEVRTYVEAPTRGLELSLDLRGTEFQQAVWQALREIPAGVTVSYQEIANRIGQPKAVRAVAQACGANPVAIFVPCHRVVRSDGGISGYRWGVQRKQALLKLEGAV